MLREPPRGEGRPSGPGALILSDRTLLQFASDWLRQAHAPGRETRLLVGIAGIPGSGKSTLASRLLEEMERQEPGAAVLIPMDGFHLPHARIEALGVTHLKGAPRTFAARRYVALLEAARRPDFLAAFPIYDRSAHDPVYTGRAEHRLTDRTRVVLTEGNYLLLNASPWNGLGDVLEETLFLDTPLDQAREWLIQRHQNGGRSLVEAEARWQQDRTNAALILAESRHADWVVRWS